MRTEPNVQLRRITGLAVLAASLSWTLSATAGGREIHCGKLRAVDGDTIKCDGVNMRDMGDGAPFKSGYDTPEIREAKCGTEKALGRKAKSRMAQLLKTPGIRILDSGEVDRHWKRPLVSVRLPDGRSVGSVLISESLARRWTPDYQPDWCS